MSKREVMDTGERLEHRSQLGDVWRRFRRNKLAVVGMCIAAALVLIAIFANVSDDLRHGGFHGLV